MVLDKMSLEAVLMPADIQRHPNCGAHVASGSLLVLLIIERYTTILLPTLESASSNSKNDYNRKIQSLRFLVCSLHQSTRHRL